MGGRLLMRIAAIQALEPRSTSRAALAAPHGPHGPHALLISTLPLASTHRECIAGSHLRLSLSARPESPSDLGKACILPATAMPAPVLTSQAARDRDR